MRHGDLGARTVTGLAIALLVAACGPGSDAPVTVLPLAAPTSRPAATAKPTPKPAAAPPVEVYSGLDRDDDGSACE
jgi:hypothetical protein